MSAASDVVYRRRGGRWISHHPGPLLAEIHALIAQRRAEGWEPMDLSRLLHPDTIAAASGARTHPAGESCPAQPDTADLAGIWAGSARMTAARRAAGQTLDDLDHQVLARIDTGADPR